MKFNRAGARAVAVPSLEGEVTLSLVRIVAASVAAEALGIATLFALVAVLGPNDLPSAQLFAERLDLWVGPVSGGIFCLPEGGGSADGSAPTRPPTGWWSACWQRRSMVRCCGSVAPHSRRYSRRRMPCGLLPGRPADGSPPGPVEHIAGLTTLRSAPLPTACAERRGRSSRPGCA